MRFCLRSAGALAAPAVPVLSVQACNPPVSIAVAVAARVALRDVLPTFKHRYAKLQEVVARIRSEVTEAGDCAAPGMIRFDPPVPVSCLVHVYLGCTVADAIATMNTVETECGIRVLSRFRDVPAFKLGTLPPTVRDLCSEAVCYCEWNMGVLNSSLPTDVFVRGWVAVCKALAALPK